MTDRTIYADTPEEAARVREMLNRNDDPEWHAGSAEPWIAALLRQLVISCGAKDVVEIGGFEGYTSAHLAMGLAWSHMPDATLTVCEIDHARAVAVQERLDRMLAFHNFKFAPRTRVVHDDSHVWIPTLPDHSIDFVWLDGNHEQAHVAREIELLWPKMRHNGLIVGHDVFGVCDLQRVFAHFGGYALDLPRLGPAGGVGILQVRHR